MNGAAFRIAVVDDEKSMRKSIREYLERYGRENELVFDITELSNAVDFLSVYKQTFDLVFLDIDMPEINGMEAAKRLRTMDNNVIIIFITALKQYAIEGYSVSALDFIVKPVSYEHFSDRMKRAVACLVAQRKRVKIVIGTDRGTVVFPSRDVSYVETYRHKLIYHVGEDVYEEFGTLKELEEQLAPDGFARCNSCYLVNLHHVRSVKRYEAVVGNATLKISKAKYMSFVATLNDFLGNGG